MYRSKVAVELVRMIYDYQKKIIVKKNEVYILEMNRLDTYTKRKEIEELESEIRKLKHKCEEIFEGISNKENHVMKKNPLIFIVDDDKPFNRFVEIYLKRNDYNRIECFYSGEECLDKIYLEPDIIILDYDFHGTSPSCMNGLQVLTKIKELNSKIKIIMMSGVMHEDVKKVIEARYERGIEDYILKGVKDIIMLKETLNNLTERGKEKAQSA